MTSNITSILARVDDAMNPVVVKELRQAVRSRFVTVTLLLFLAVLLLAIHVHLLNLDDMGSGGSGNFEAGRDIFMTLQGVVAFTCILFVPIYAGVRFAAERNGENVDLLFISTIRPSSIIWGKLFSAMVVAVLIYSAVLPFMTLTYLLRGIDLPTIFIVVGLHALVILLATMGAIFLACIPTSLILKAIIGLLYGAALFATASMVTGGSAGIAYSGMGSQLDSWEFWSGAMLFIEKLLLATGLLFVLSVSLVSPPSSNRALPVRLFIMGAWLVELMVAGVILAVAAAGGVVGDIAEVVVGFWIGGQVVLLSLGLLVAVCERDTWTPRVLRHVPRSLPGRASLFLLASGSAGGTLWAVGMIVLTILGGWALWALGDASGSSMHDVPELIVGFGMFGAYAYCYAMSGALIRWVYRRRLLPRMAAVFTLALIALGCLAPMILAFFIWGSRWDHHDHFILMLMPFGPLAEMNDEEFLVISGFLLAIWGVVVTMAAIPWFKAQWSGFRRYEPAPVPAAEAEVAPAPLAAVTP